VVVFDGIRLSWLTTDLPVLYLLNSTTTFISVFFPFPLSFLFYFILFYFILLYKANLISNIQNYVAFYCIESVYLLSLFYLPSKRQNHTEIDLFIRI
jgi:hypothetical protein